MENKKMISMAQKLDMVFKVLQVLIIGALLLSFVMVGVLTVVDKVNPNAVIESDFESVIMKLGPVSIEMTPEYAPDHGDVMLYCWIILALGATNGLALWLGLRYIRNIIEPMKRGNPFQADVVKNFRKLSWVVLAVGIVRNIVNFAAVNISAAMWQLEKLTQFESVQKVQVTGEMEIGFILVFFGVLLMSYIFEYGISLQQLSDETL